MIIDCCNVNIDQYIKYSYILYYNYLVCHWDFHGKFIDFSILIELEYIQFIHSLQWIPTSLTQHSNTVSTTTRVGIITPIIIIWIDKHY